MFDFHEKRKIKALVFSKVTILLLLVACGFLAKSVYGLYQRERETAHKLDERASELTELTERAAALEARVEYFESDRGIEAEIRDRYDVVKEGEEMVIVIEQPDRPDENEPAPTEEKERGVLADFFSKLMFWQ